MLVSQPTYTYAKTSLISPRFQLLSYMSLTDRVPPFPLHLHLDPPPLLHHPHLLHSKIFLPQPTSSVAASASPPMGCASCALYPHLSTQPSRVRVSLQRILYSRARMDGSWVCRGLPIRAYEVQTRKKRFVSPLAATGCGSVC